MAQNGGYDISGSSWGNNEYKYYTNHRENSYLADGVLHIRAMKESFEGKDYISARMLTKDKFELNYGYVEARIALPKGTGIWPAFLMLGNNIDAVSWPSCSEIDIIEAINTENKIYSTCHQNSNRHAEFGKSTGTFNITQFHTYHMYWDKDYIRCGIDGGQQYEILIKEGTGNTCAFHNKFFFILNIVVGGNWPGFYIDNNQFPSELKIDYIRLALNK